MEPAYLTWFGVGAVGLVAGLFITPLTVLKLAGMAFAISLAGLVVSAALSQETLTWVFGLAGMVIPVLGAVATLGAAFGAVIRRAARGQSAHDRKETT